MIHTKSKYKHKDRILDYSKVNVLKSINCNILIKLILF